MSGYYLTARVVKPIAVLVTALVATRGTAEEGVLKVSLELAQRRVARGDCQIGRVTLKNESDRRISLISPLALGLGRPQFELTCPDEPAELVVAVGQGTGSGILKETFIEPGRTKSVFAVFVWRRSEHGGRDGPIFEKAGNYSFRVGVEVGENTIWSDPASCELLPESNVTWTKSREFSLRRIMLSLLPPEASERDSLRLPDESLLGKLAALTAAADTVLGGADFKRTAWSKLKSQQSPLLADYASGKLADLLVKSHRFDDALLELDSMNNRIEGATEIVESARIEYEKVRAAPRDRREKTNE